MAKQLLVGQGIDGNYYPYTSPELVKDENGKSVKTKFEEVDAQLQTKANISNLEIIAINQSNVTGDCIVLKTNKGKNIIFDTGSMGGWSEIYNHLSKLTQIDMLIITHYHLDHIGNFENVLKLCNPSTKVILPYEPNFDNFIGNGEEFRNLTQTVYNLCTQYNVNKIIATEDLTITIDDINLKFMNCSNTFFNNYYNEQSEFHVGETDYNNFALVTEITHNNNNILLCSDISLKAQELLSPKFKKYNLVQAPHHSVDTNVNRTFIETIKADMVFCSSYYLTSVYNSMFARHHIIRNVPFYVTRHTGDITIISDGFKLQTKNKSLFKEYNAKEAMKGYGVNNLMYYTFTDIKSDFSNTTTLEEIITLMGNGSVAIVNFDSGFAVTPPFISVIGGMGIITKHSNNKANVLLFDCSKSRGNMYLGTWLNGEGNVSWANMNSSSSIWVKSELTESWRAYSTNPDTTPVYNKKGNVVNIKGVITPTNTLTGDTNKITILTLPTECRPTNFSLSQICQGKGNCIWFLTIELDGKVTFSRHRVGDTITSVTSGDYIPFNITYTI